MARNHAGIGYRKLSTGVLVGSITYDGMVVHIDDRTLTHLQIVIVNKLRKGDGFLMSWKDSRDVGDGRSSVWIPPTVLIHFKFEGGRVPTINEGWLAELSASADSSRGLIITAEHGDLAKVGSTAPSGAVETVAEASKSGN